MSSTSVRPFGLGLLISCRCGQSWCCPYGCRYAAFIDRDLRQVGVVDGHCQPKGVSMCVVADPVVFQDRSLAARPQFEELLLVVRGGPDPKLVRVAGLLDSQRFPEVPDRTLLDVIRLTE